MSISNLTSVSQVLIKSVDDAFESALFASLSFSIKIKSSIGLFHLKTTSP